MPSHLPAMALDRVIDMEEKAMKSHPSKCGSALTTSALAAALLLGVASAAWAGSPDHSATDDRASYVGPMPQHVGGLAPTREARGAYAYGRPAYTLRRTYRDR
jgi:hypothetical protein